MLADMQSYRCHLSHSPLYNHAS